MILHETSTYTSETGHLQCLERLVEAQSFLSSNLKINNNNNVQDYACTVEASM